MLLNRSWNSRWQGYPRSSPSALGVGPAPRHLVAADVHGAQPVDAQVLIEVGRPSHDLVERGARRQVFRHRVTGVAHGRTGRVVAEIAARVVALIERHVHAGERVHLGGELGREQGAGRGEHRGEAGLAALDLERQRALPTCVIRKDGERRGGRREHVLVKRRAVLRRHHDHARQGRERLRVGSFDQRGQEWEGQRKAADALQKLAPILSDHGHGSSCLHW